MSDASTRPVIFISYTHADEPEKPADGDVQWLGFVMRFLRPAVKSGVFDIWVDRQMTGGADWDPEIETKLRACDIFILLVSASSMASDYIIRKEIAIIRERQANGEAVHFYPLLLSPTPRAGLDRVRDKNLRPRDANPLSGCSAHDRAQHMTDAATEIAAIAEDIANRKAAAQAAEQGPAPRGPSPALIHILSLVAKGGADKSALINEWLKRMRKTLYIIISSLVLLGVYIYAPWFFSKKFTEMYFRFDDHTAYRWGWRIDNTTSSKDKDIKVNGALYHNSIFVNPDDSGEATKLIFDVSNIYQYTRFSVKVAIVDSADCPHGDAIVQIKTNDGTNDLWDSKERKLRRGEKPFPIDVPLNNSVNLELLAKVGPSRDMFCAHVGFLDGRFSWW
jgi:hypothetical protein